MIMPTLSPAVPGPGNSTPAPLKTAGPRGLDGTRVTGDSGTNQRCSGRGKVQMITIGVCRLSDAPSQAGMLFKR